VQLAAQLTTLLLSRGNNPFSGSLQLLRKHRRVNGDSDRIGQHRQGSTVRGRQLALTRTEPNGELAFGGAAAS
jgi:hypothetical protein